MWFENPVSLMRVAIRILCDTEPQPDGTADAAYLFGHSFDLEQPILGAGAALYRHGATNTLLVCKLAPNHPENGYRDFAVWQNELKERFGIPEISVHPIVSPAAENPEEKPPLSHTGTEAELLVLFAKKHGLKQIYVVSHPVHIIRAFSLTAGFAMKLYPELKVYAFSGMLPPWDKWSKKVTANQGVVKGTLGGTAIQAEYDRLNKVYGNKYDLVSAEEVLHYLDERDAQ